MHRLSKLRAGAPTARPNLPPETAGRLSGTVVFVGNASHSRGLVSRRLMMTASMPNPNSPQPTPDNPNPEPARPPTPPETPNPDEPPGVPPPPPDSIPTPEEEPIQIPPEAPPEVPTPPVIPPEFVPEQLRQLPGPIHHSARRCACRAAGRGRSAPVRSPHWPSSWWAIRRRAGRARRRSMRQAPR